MVEGIDVSRYQGTINWASVKTAGKQFAAARCTIGMSTQDPTFAANYKAIISNGLVPGVYHLLTGTSTGAEQAANIKKTLDAVGFQKGFIAIDVEGWSETTSTPKETILANVEYLCNWIRDAYKRTPIIYTGAFWRDYLKQPINNFGSKLWLAAYVADPDPYVPVAWATYKIWQYASTGAVSGITGNVDLDKSVGTLNSLKMLAGWEWDELATQEEIRAVVADELSKAVTALQSSDLSVQAALVDKLNEVVANIGVIANAEISTKASVIDSRTVILDKIDATSAILTTLSESLANEDALDILALQTKLDSLHAHVCQRVDLHTL